MVKRRTQARARIAFFGALMLLCSISPLSAQAAEVVDLRIGVHPDYTRVVFELDRPAAYKVERGSRLLELVVSLDADSIARKVKSSNSLIGSIQLEPTATGSKARITLTREGLNLKEMILANPPRIVLDVIVPKAKLAKEPVAALKAAAATSRPVRKPQAKAAAPKQPAKIIAAAPAKPEKAASKAPAKTAPAPTAKPVAKAKATPTPAPGLKPPPRPTRPLAPPVAVQPRPEPNPIKPDDSTAWAKQIFALVGLAAVLVIWVMVRRRRGRIPLPTRERSEGLADPHKPEASNPFVEPSPGLEEPMLLKTKDPGAAPEADGLAEESPGDSRHAGEEDSEPRPPLAAEPAPPRPEIVEPTAPAPAAPDLYAASRAAGREAAEEAVALVRGFEEKIRDLQQQLEEAVASRERMERQMAAQNEELRVQRAAIARTQRAVRNISRPEEESHGDAGAPVAD
jgi:hypothetical protein